MIVHRVGASTPRAFVDNLADLVEEWLRDAPSLEQTFHEFSLIFILGPSIPKTVCNVFWPIGLCEVKGAIRTQMPGRVQIQVAHKRIYLGFVVGPGKGTQVGASCLESMLTVLPSQKK